MAGEYFYPGRGYRHQDVVTLGGYWTMAGTTPTKANGRGWTVARTSAGVYTVTFDRTYVDYLSCDVSLATTALTQLSPQFGPILVSTAKTMVIRTQLAGVATEVGNGDAVNFAITLLINNVGKGT